MNELAVFSSPDFGTVRTYLEPDGTILCCASDVAKALGYERPNNAIAAHCKGALKRGTLTNGGEQQLNFIPEGDVYRLIVSSKLPLAEKFEHWLFDEVVPSIRKHGMYATPQTLEKLITSPDFGIRLLQELKSEQEKRKVLEVEAEENKPLIDFAKGVSETKGLLYVREFAKLLNKAGYPTGQRRLFEELRQRGYLCKNGQNNEPTQAAINNGWLVASEYVKTNPFTGQKIITITPLITGKGQKYFFELFTKNIHVENGSQLA